MSSPVFNSFNEERGRSVEFWKHARAIDSDRAQLLNIL